MRSIIYRYDDKANYVTVDDVIYEHEYLESILMEIPNLTTQEWVYINYQYKCALHKFCKDNINTTPVKISKRNLE